MGEKRNCNAKVVTDIWPKDAEAVVPGHIQFNETKNGLQVLFGCPCGCGDMRCVDIYQNGEKPPSPSWLWDGNKENPTLSPSLLLYKDNHQEHWHGYLRNGVFEEC